MTKYIMPKELENRMATEPAMSIDMPIVWFELIADVLAVFDSPDTANRELPLQMYGSDLVEYVQNAIQEKADRANEHKEAFMQMKAMEERARNGDKDN